MSVEFPGERELRAMRQAWIRAQVPFYSETPATPPIDILEVAVARSDRAVTREEIGKALLDIWSVQNLILDLIDEEI